MTERRTETSKIKMLIVAFALIRAATVLIIWLVLFLAMFVGYFTVPVFVVGAVMLLFALPDIGLYVRVSSLEDARREREVFLETESVAEAEVDQSEDTHEDQG